jgi:hypothetical protein
MVAMMSIFLMNNLSIKYLGMNPIAYALHFREMMEQINKQFYMNHQLSPFDLMKTLKLK